MRWGIAFVTIVYFAVVFFLAGLGMALQGDCGAGTTQIEASECSRNAVIAGLVVLAIGAVLYVAAWRYIRRRW